MFHADAYSHVTFLICSLRGCLHDTVVTFLIVQVYLAPSLRSVFDSNVPKSHSGTSHTGASSPQLLFWNNSFIPDLKLVVTVSCIMQTMYNHSV